MREMLMHKFTISAAAIALATFGAAPASAERNWGPVQDNGKCWHAQVNHGGNSAGTWGYWEACPQPAAARGGQLHHPLRARRDLHNDR
jgi:hypothetical protein